MHKFSTVSPKPSALTALRDPQAGAPGLLDVPYSMPAVPDPQAGAPAPLVRTAFSAPRYENLCIIRAGQVCDFALGEFAAAGPPSSTYLKTVLTALPWGSLTLSCPSVADRSVLIIRSSVATPDPLENTGNTSLSSAVSGVG